MQKTKRTFRILPILCGSFAEAMEKEKSPMALDGVAGLIAGLKRIVASRPRASVFLAAGADLSHIGPRFGGDTPVTKGTLRDLERIDRETLVFVEKGDAEGLFNNVARDENARNICGLAAIYVMLKVLEPCEAALLGYEQASDEDGSGCVTFAACAVA
jgi:AmmeMemoRadiSam system protein B